MSIEIGGYKPDQNNENQSEKLTLTLDDLTRGLERIAGEAAMKKAEAYYLALEREILGLPENTSVEDIRKARWEESREEKLRWWTELGLPDPITVSDEELKRISAERIEQYGTTYWEEKKMVGRGYGWDDDTVFGNLKLVRDFCLPYDEHMRRKETTKK